MFFCDGRLAWLVDHGLALLLSMLTDVGSEKLDNEAFDMCAIESRRLGPLGLIVGSASLVDDGVGGTDDGEGKISRDVAA